MIFKKNKTVKYAGSWGSSFVSWPCMVIGGGKMNGRFSGVRDSGINISSNLLGIRGVL